MSYLSRYPKNTLGSITYLLTCGGVLHNLTKTYKETYTLIRVFNNQTPWVYTIGGVLFILKITQYTYDTPRLSQKYIMFHNLKHGGVMHSATKTYKQSNTLLGVFNKKHGLNYFNLNYQRVLLMARNIQ
jgi:hypothetical protein